jgi:hypothetical protein
VAGDGANYKWKVQETEVKVPIVANDEVTVTGKVGALATDFQLDLVASKSATLQQNEENEYQITYGSYLNSATKPLKIVAEWTEEMDVVDYSPGSASLTDGGVVPVIDTINRTITWTINSFPANTRDKTVSFRLVTNNSYTGDRIINFTVKAWLYGANVVSIDKSVINSYRYYSSVTPTPVPTTSGSSTTSSGGSTIAPTPTAVPVLKIEKIDIVQLTDGMVTVAVGNNIQPARVKIIYGTTVSGLNNSLTSINKLVNQQMSIDGLQPGKDYYFKVQVVDDLGRVATSDTYTFRTADTSETATVNKDTVILTVENNVISDNKDRAVVVTEQNCAFKFKVSKPEKIKQIQLFIRNSQVLGVNTVYAMDLGQLQSDLVETGDGGYLGHVMSPEKPGVYEIVVRVVGFNGSVNEQKIGTLEVVAPLMIKTEDRVGIEGARVILSRLNLANIYEVVAPSSLGIKNPAYTDSLGQIKLTLPKGNYRIEISLAGFASKTVDFSIGMGGDNKMPQVVLEKQRGNIGSYIGFYGDSTKDLGQLIKNFSDQLIVSVRFFKVMMMIQIMTGGIIWICFYRNKNEKEKPESILKKGIEKFVFSLILAFLVIFLILDLLFGLKFGMAAVIWIILAIINLGLFISLVNI